MLGHGDAVPDALVWANPIEDPVQLRDAIAGDGYALLCFYPFDWSPGCTNEVLLLDQRDEELMTAGIRTFGISRDSPWSHEQWTISLGTGVPLLSDWTGDATRGFGVAMDVIGMADVSARSAFLIEGDTVRAAWELASELPDLDAVLAAASSLSP